MHRVTVNNKFVRKRLIDLDMTVSDLADASGVSRQAVYAALRGENTTLETVGRIAYAIDAAVVDCIKEENGHSPLVDASASPSVNDRMREAIA